jgi:type II secretory pathway component GspD/PulD (secretin)
MTNCIGRGLVAALALGVAAAGGLAVAQAPAQPPALAPQPGDDAVTLNFVNADIHAVIKAVADMTGRNFLIDPRVQGAVNIVAPRPVPRNMVFPILLSVQLGVMLVGWLAVNPPASLAVLLPVMSSTVLWFLIALFVRLWHGKSLLDQA